MLSFGFFNLCNDIVNSSKNVSVLIYIFLKILEFQGSDA